jgi:hypothetical protein
VKLEIKLSGIELRTRLLLFHFCHQPLQMACNLWRQTRAAELERFGFQDNPDTIDPLRVLTARAVHEHTAPGMIHEKPLFLELHECFAHGNPAHVELTGQERFVNRSPGRYFPEMMRTKLYAIPVIS